MAWGQERERERESWVSRQLWRTDRSVGQAGIRSLQPVTEAKRLMETSNFKVDRLFDFLSIYGNRGIQCVTQ